MTVLGRVARLVDFVCAQPRPPSLTEVARTLEEPPSSVHRILAELVELRLLTRSDDATYRAGPRLAQWGQAAVEGLDVAQLSRPFLDQLRDRTGESVRLYVRDGDGRICAAAAEGTFELRHVVQVGRHLPLRVGAAGKVLLAYAEADCQARELALATSDPVSPRALSSDRLKEELEHVRRTGVSFSFNEREEGLYAAAVPVRDRSGAVIAAISVSGPSSRLTPDMLAALRPWLEETAAGLTRALGGVEYPAGSAI